MAISERTTKEKPRPHFDQTSLTWRKLQQYLKEEGLGIDGKSLDIAGVVAVSRHDCSPSIALSPELLKGIEDSVSTLKSYLADGSYVYGVNTGFGGSADVRTNDLLGLQVALMQHTQSAVITSHDISNTIHEELGRHVMPSNWVKGTMLVRANANIRGHSAVTLPVAQTILELVRQDCTPLIPLRGSISASGDLMPLSYIAGSIMGNPDIHVKMGKKHGDVIRRADEALKELDIDPIVLGPKEGLGLINGTAASAAVASLALYEANNLALISQLLAAMAAEGQAANVEWTHPFVHDIRPHSGQIETAYNLRCFLSASKLVVGLQNDKDRFKVGLCQDRYALRSTPQWMSPLLEDLLLAQRQLTTELNSTSDNPVVNVAENDIHSGANFQAVAVTSASEKVRFCLQMMGKMLFSQTSELINNTLNNGLPPNLVADDPSLSFGLKGLDVNMAAYMSELAYLANPVSSHVQSTEMHNQAVNSLALLTSRYTMQAVELVSLMCAGQLYTACQALDLRVMHITYLESLAPIVQPLLQSHLQLSEKPTTALLDRVLKAISTSWYAGTCLDAHERTAKCASDTVPAILDFLASDDVQPASGSGDALRQVQKLKAAIDGAMLETYTRHRTAFFDHQTTSRYLGAGSRQLYGFVRDTLQVPFHRGLVEQPSPFAADANEIPGRGGAGKKIIGSWLSIIYEAIRDGRLIGQVMLVGEAAGAVDGGRGEERREHVPADGNATTAATGNGHRNGNGNGNGVSGVDLEHRQRMQGAASNGI